EGVTSIRVLRFQEDGVAFNSTLAEYPTPMDRSKKLFSITLCARFKIFFLHSRGCFLKLQDTVTRREAMLKGGWLTSVIKSDLD
ncbi:hypothetical protein SK128_008291, partial [Halocaridina rubra]